MNPIDSNTLARANEEAIFNLWLYLADKTEPDMHIPFWQIILDLEAALQRSPAWNENDIHRLRILKNAVNRSAVLAESRISNFTHSENGLTACAFTKPNGEVSVVFRGTGSGEWIDNGEGLSGIPEENTYMTFGRNGRLLFRRTVQKDYASGQQAGALNWFHQTAAANGWTASSGITVSGHSKGGNKAQFIAIHSDLVKICCSFNGQGFSPEALTALQKRYKTAFETRRQKIHSFAANNDCVSVLGQPLVPPHHIYYFEAMPWFHPMESMLDFQGQFYPQSEQGMLSRYAESLSQELMSMEPAVRQHIVLGIMNIFQKHLGKGIPVNDDEVSLAQTIMGIRMAVRMLLTS